MKWVNSVCYSIRKDRAVPWGALQLPLREKEREVERDKGMEKKIKKDGGPWRAL